MFSRCYHRDVPNPAIEKHLLKLASFFSAIYITFLLAMLGITVPFIDLVVLSLPILLSKSAVIFI